jgi:Ca2+-transporting ATPase
LALSIDPPEKDIMSRPPRDPKESIFTRRTKAMILGVGALMPISVLLVFFLYNPTLADSPSSPSPPYVYAMTMAFTTMVMFEMFNVYMCRSDKYTLHKVGFFKNKYLNISVIFSLALQLIVIYTPFAEIAFETRNLIAIDWLFVVAASCIPLVAGEIGKVLFPWKPGRKKSPSIHA